MHVLNPNQRGLVVGAFLGGWHLLWAIPVAVGLGQELVTSRSCRISCHKHPLTRRHGVRNGEPVPQATRQMRQGSVDNDRSCQPCTRCSSVSLRFANSCREPCRRRRLRGTRRPLSNGSARALSR